jgi:hypothetical protein
MSVSALALVLILAPSPEELWARIVDPATPAEERIDAVEAARGVLPPEYIPKLAAARLAEQESRTPRPELRDALERVVIPAGSADGYTVVRDLPCSTYFEERVILETLRSFPMTAETYGVVRNIVTPRDGEFIPRSVPEWWSFAGADDRDAAQAFIVALSPPHETDGAMFVSEAILTVSRMMFDLERMLARMHPRGSEQPFPATAFLALADRIAKEPIHDGNECMLVHDAARLLETVDDSPFPRDLRFTDGCLPALDQFRDWLDNHRGELEARASEELPAVEEARMRMDRVSLCRP